MKLYYITLKVIDINLSKKLYECFGFNPILEKHGNGPEHYSIQIEGFVLEIYPSAITENVDFSSIRIGFQVSDISPFVDRLENFCKTFQLPFKFSSNLNRIEIKDFEKRTIEFIQN